MTRSILVVTTDSALRASAVHAARALDLRTREAGNVPTAAQRLAEEQVEVVLADEAAFDEGLVDAVAALRPRPTLALFGGDGAPALRDAASIVMRIAPPHTPQQIEAALAGLLRSRLIEHERDRLRKESLESVPMLLTGGSRAARRLREIVERIASTPRTTVLILGERGSGRRAVAREIHERSAFARSPLVSLQCAGASSNTMDDALHAAGGGTLVLNAIDELDPALQERLALFLQERQVLRPGGRAVPAAGVRIVATTHRDLAQRVEQRAFRDDLHYRLNVLSLAVPALRERREDLPALIEGTLTRLAHEHAFGTTRLSPEATRAVYAHAWPGNLRELRSVLEAALMRSSGGTIQLDDVGLPSTEEPEPAVAAPLENAALTIELGDRSLRSLEEALIRRVLVETAGNRSRTARLLGVNRATLYNKLKLYGI